VVIFQENVSFDHYFGTYPHAANTDGNPFHAQPGTPSVNGLIPALLAHNPNSANPQRLTPAQALTCDQDHAYTAEQQAMDGGLMEKFVEFTNNSGATPLNAAGQVVNPASGIGSQNAWLASPTAAATASGCRSCSSRPTPRPTTSAARPPIRPLSWRSSRTTGWAGSGPAAARSTAWPAPGQHVQLRPSPLRALPARPGHGRTRPLTVASR
jgi:hypothetical protein